MTASAKTATKCMVVLFTVGEAFVLKEVAVMERHLTLLAHETVGVPLKVENIYISNKHHLLSSSMS